ncbi:hypothetical protein LCGC14_1365720 [marine sediment metagenome]|uniref:Uncharacterized protein n=1 Tax=marine sediment metagenome TaxID=412755 RepID=A0A0F9N8Y4_9ZZZZ
MKKLVMGIVLVVALLFGGCEKTFTPEQMKALAAQNEVLQVQLDKVQAVATEVWAEMQANAEIVDADAIARLAKVNEEVDRVQALLDTIARALQGVTLTGDAAQDFISQLQAVNAASGGVNPYVVPVGAGLSALSLVLGWLAKRKTAEAAVNKKKYQAHKQGVEKTMKEVSASPSSEVVALEAKLYTNIGDARADLGI